MLKIPRYYVYALGYGVAKARKTEDGVWCKAEDVEKALAEKDAAYNLLAEASRALVIDAARPFTDRLDQSHVFADAGFDVRFTKKAAEGGEQ